MSKHSYETLYVDWWGQDLTLNVEFTYYGGYAGSRLQPPEDPEIEIIKVTDEQSGVDLTDFLTKERVDQLTELLFEKHEEYVRQAEEARAETAYERMQDERWLR